MPASGQSKALLLEAEVTRQLQAFQRVLEKENQLEYRTSTWPLLPPVTEKQEPLQHFFPFPLLSHHLTPPSLTSLSPPLPFYHYFPFPPLQPLQHWHPDPQLPYHPPLFPHHLSCYSMPYLYPPANQNIELEELRDFAKELKQQRIKLGLTQRELGLAVGCISGKNFSTSTISRFEGLNLSFKYMCKLKPLLQKWLELKHDDKNGQRLRKRTSIGKNVRYALEKAFSKNPKPSSEEIQMIGDQLMMEKEVVRVWFCNKRQREKLDQYTIKKKKMYLC